MPMSFPTHESVVNRAKQRGFRAPCFQEDEDHYRTAFANFMVNVDRLESSEIRTASSNSQMNAMHSVFDLLRKPTLKSTPLVQMETETIPLLKEFYLEAEHVWDNDVTKSEQLDPVRLYHAELVYAAEKFALLADQVKETIRRLEIDIQYQKDIAKEEAEKENTNNDI